jgi:hypothetical protein
LRWQKIKKACILHSCVEGVGGRKHKTEKKWG